MDIALENLVKSTPEPVISAIRALQNPRRFSIAVLLLDSGKQSLAYLGRATQSENGALIPQLKALEEAGILHNDWHDQKRAGDPDNKNHPAGIYSVYQITAFGKQLIEVIAASLASTRLPLLKALGNQLRFALVRYMLANGALSFSRVAAITGLEKSAVAAHLGKLEVGGLVEKSFNRDKESGEYSMYAATRAASDIVPRLLLLEQYRVVSTGTRNIMVQEKVLENLRATIMGTGAASDADFCHQVLDLARSLVDALLAAGSTEEKKEHAKKLASACDALKKYTESILVS